MQTPAGQARTRRLGALAVACAVLLNASAAGAWRRALAGAAEAVVVDGTGEPIVASAPPSLFFSAIRVTKLARSGQRRWRFRGGFGLPAALALVPGGDVVVAGELVEGLSGGGLTSFLVVSRIDGRRGTKRWRAALADGAAAAVTPTADGDVLAAGTLAGAFAVVRLGGDAGDVRWATVLTGAGAAAVAVARDAAGDVFATGGPGDAFVIAKLAAGDGAELWRHTIPGGVAAALAVDPGGDAFVAGSIGAALVLVRLDGATGDERWRTILPGGAAAALGVDRAGDVIVGGRLDTDGRSHLAVAKITGATGGERWRWTASETGSGDQVRSLAVDPAGDVLATGTVTREHATLAFATIVLAGTDGTLRTERLIGGRAGGLGSGAAVAVGDATGVAVGSVARQRGRRTLVHTVVVGLRAAVALPGARR